MSTIPKAADPNLLKIWEASEKNRSLFEEQVRKMALPVQAVFLDNKKIVAAGFEPAADKLALSPDAAEVRKSFPKLYPVTKDEVLQATAGNRPQTKGCRVAVLFSGGPAAGGHNVIVGLKKALGTDNTLLGVRQGPKGLLAGNLFEIADEDLQQVVNTGGFDFLGSDRTKIKGHEQFKQVKAVCHDNRLDAIVVIGGDDSNTNAAMLAEYLYENVHADGRGVQVVGVPKTIDGDLQVGEFLPISFGFDTATKIYSELVGNILQDTPSSRKYWHFIKLMGRSATHVALEVALQTKPAVAFVSEEIEEKNLSLAQSVDIACRAIARRAGKGINHGVILIPEGLIEFIPEMKALIQELNEVMAKFDKVLNGMNTMAEKKDFIYGKISAPSAKLMASLPDEFENMLLLDRDSHGNLQVSQIPTEKLLIEMVRSRLREMKADPTPFVGQAADQVDLTPEEVERFVKSKFATNHHFFGYEGRCGAPTRFDAAYTFNLGLTAGSLLLAGKTGYMVAVNALDQQGAALAIPLTGLICIERRQGKDEMVIEKALVKSDSPAFKYFLSVRERWSNSDCFSSPGPRQLWGPTAKQLPIIVALNQGYANLEFSLGEEIDIF
ncbi:diphosphate--fructose-6-phosphate 1-phosphotransferase [bacterium]|nr:diphosphate--fructose-6-phosphate 1-phosphotransferase [bacterium]